MSFPVSIYLEELGRKNTLVTMTHKVTWVLDRGESVNKPWGKFGPAGTELCKGGVAPNAEPSYPKAIPWISNSEAFTCT